MFWVYFVSRWKTYQTVITILLMKTSIRWEAHILNDTFLVWWLTDFSWINFMLSGWIVALSLLNVADWVTADKARPQQLWLSVTLHKRHCAFLPFPVSPALPNLHPLYSSPSQPCAISWRLVPFEYFSCQSWIFICSCQKQPHNHGTGRLIHLVTCSQLAQTDSCTGTLAVVQGEMYWV